MKIDFSKTDQISATPNVAVSCVYQVIGDSRYQGSKKAGIFRKGTVAIRTFGGIGKLYFHNGENMELPENSLVVVPYSKIARYTPQKDKWHFWWFEYQSGEGMLSEEELFIIPFSEDEEKLCNYILKTLQEKSYLSSQEASASFSMLLCNWRRKTESFGKQKQSHSFYQLVQEIRTQPGNEYTIEKMAEKCYLSSRRLRDVFIENTGLSPKKFLIRVRMEYACDLLTHTPLSISAIAEKCGYPDRLYFSRVFTEYYGISPRRFREKAE